MGSYALHCTFYSSRKGLDRHSKRHSSTSSRVLQSSRFMTRLLHSLCWLILPCCNLDMWMERGFFVPVIVAFSWIYAVSHILYSLNILSFGFNHYFLISINFFWGLQFACLYTVLVWVILFRAMELCFVRQKVLIFE